ncbi:5' nucleotidase, NT5C type [Thermodesulfovibrio yellowstonii]|uniref:5' nucleotidase, NT5C type n=1 Tax=Thermodesulfovibrio yellowstonii TaxID=28262 RepID=UPI00040DFE90|nr:hypothetical protein [Thermodesulfovibrio islandicus]
MSKIILVDIDNTLWDFASVFYKELRKLNPAVPPPDNWHCWDFWKEYLEARDFYRAVNEIHSRQEEFGIYPDAPEFLQGLKELGYNIIIASHRSSDNRIATVNWLDKHNLTFDDLHLSYDKTILFSHCIAVVDDSPHILSKAYEKGITATGLEFAWNRGNGFVLHRNLFQVLEFLKDRC